jgi:hypothetical protein
MTDLRTVSPDELPELSEIPEDLRAVVFSPNGPLQSVGYEKLLTKLIATDLAKPNKAALDADLAHAVDSVALVHGDPTPALNGWYRKLGASGAGSWEQFEELARNARIAAEAAAEAANEAADEVSAALSEVNAAGASQIAAVAAAAASVINSYPLDLNVRMQLLEAAVSIGAMGFALAQHAQAEMVTLKQRLAAVERGDIAAWALAARIRNHGWTLEIDVAEANRGGTFDVSKLRMISYDKGFNEHCQPCVRPRAIEVTRAMRKASPNQAQLQETVSGGIATWRLSLSKQMFARARTNPRGVTVNSGFDPILYLAEGWYADGGVNAPDQDGLRVQNNSTEAYPAVGVRNYLPPHRLLGATGKFEISGNSVVATEGRVYAAARCDITGVTSGVTRSQIVSAMIASDAYPKLTNAVPVFQANISMTPFTQGETVTERWRIYPWIGDTPTDSAAGSYLAGTFCNYPHVANPLGTYGKVYAVVNPSTGSDTTGAASTVSEAAAAATPFLTDRAAWRACLALNVSTYGRNNQSGIELCFSDGLAHTLTLLKTVSGTGTAANFDATEMGVGGTWAIMRPVNGAANCRIARDTGNSGRTVPRRTVLRGFHGLDLVGADTGTTILLDGGEANDGTYGQEVWVDGSPFINSFGTTSTTYGLYRCGMVFMTACGTQPALNARALNPGNLRQEMMLCRDTDFPAVAGWPSPRAVGGVVADFSAGGAHLETNTTNTNRILPWDNPVMVGFTIRSSNNAAFPLEINRATVASGINVLIEIYGVSQSAAMLSGDGQNFRCSNFFFDYFTIVGGRPNIGYEDTFVMADDGDPEQQLKKLMMFRRSILREANTKTELFPPANGARIHTWNVAHRVGWEYVLFIEADSGGATAPGNGNWIGEAWPSTLLFVGPDARSQFENYQASHRAPAVSGAGGGNYTPAAGSVFLNRIPANDEACPIDLIGTPRNGSVGALERAA